MVKKSLKEYLDKYFEKYKESMGSYPKVCYDLDEETSLVFGEIDEEGYIQWKYQEKTEQTDFTELEQEFGIKLPESFKEFHNSYYFLCLEGFYHGESVYIEEIPESRDILEELTYIFENESKQYIPLGMYGNMDLTLSMEVATGKIVTVDYETDEEKVIADSLEQVLDEMVPVRE